MKTHRLPNQHGDLVADGLRHGWDTLAIARILRTDEARVYNFIAGYGGIKQFLDEWPAA